MNKLKQVSKKQSAMKLKRALESKKASQKKRPKMTREEFAASRELSLELLASIERLTDDIKKTIKGNKTAAQRVRVQSILLEKEFLGFRKTTAAEMKIY